MAHAGGRPTDYDDTVISKVDEYLETTGREQTELPTVEGFGLYIGVDDDTIVEWRKKYPKFSAAYKKLFSRQKNQLINDGLYGGKDINAGMAIFLLKVNHGMVETDRHEVTGRNGKDLNPVLVKFINNADDRDTK